MNQVKVLIEGYAKEIKDGWLASSTTTLIISDNKKIIVDPGTNRKLLLEKLAENKLGLNDINFVFMTHTHPDHVLLAGLFEKAIVVDNEMVYEGDKQYIHQGKIPGTDIKIIATPGHDPFHASLLVKTKEGIICVAGDLFWWADNEKQISDSVDMLLNHQDPFVKDKKALKQSRQKILKVADRIIPGHGKMFRNNIRK